VQGWIKLHRSLSSHWIMDDAEYLRAWVVILMQVNHKESKVMIKKKLLICGAGESLNSLDTWGRMFGNWSKSKTNRFLNMLKSEEMIGLKSERVTTRLTVCNYDSYQDTRNASDTPLDTADETQTKRRRATNKNDKNEENEKNDKNTPNGDGECSQELFIEPIRKVKEPTARENLFEEFWIAYGRKGNKKKSKALFLKLKDEQVVEIQNNLPAYLFNTKENLKFRKDAQVYLNPANEHWNDVVFIEVKEKSADAF